MKALEKSGHWPANPSTTKSHAVSQHLVEIQSAILFAEYLQSLGVQRTSLDREQEIYVQDRHLATVLCIQGELRFYLRANALARS